VGIGGWVHCGGSLERCEGGAEGPVALKVEYAKRQHYVKIVGVAQWEGWADAGSVIKLNATVVGGVEYIPTDEVAAVVVTGPGVYRPFFYAVYRTVARDVLGVPNPLATVRLCNATAQAGLAGFVVVETYTQELCQPTVKAPPHQPLHSRRSRRSSNCGRPRAEEEEKITGFFSFNSPNRDFPTEIIIPVRLSL